MQVGDRRSVVGAAGRAAERPPALEVRSTTDWVRTSRSSRPGGSPTRADSQVDVVAVAAVQEEIGLYGARAAAFGLAPDVAIVVDVTPATDAPGGDPRRAGRIELGMGAMIARGPMLNKHVTELLGSAAEAERIPHAYEIYSRITSTDADETHPARAGIPTGLLSIPTRYLHSPNEICDLDDVESIIRLIVAFAQRLAADQSFVR